MSEFPHTVEEHPHVTIPLSDGTRLSARIWMPEGAEQNPVPAILEYIPYRKRDMTARRDTLMHPYFAGHGYACVRVDIRGSGESEGILWDEYTELEFQDGLEVLRWLEEQPWCNGCVGMIGISWGGFNGLQIAAYQPPQLKAVVTVASTDDRYADDVHYMGGCLLGDNLSWASTMFAYNSCPPDPALVGEKWREMWMNRLENSVAWLDKWLEHQRRDTYWKHGSIAEDFSAVQCPVFAVSGWADGYSNAVFRMLMGLKGPRMGLVGPWGHKYPHVGYPGPAIGFLQECLRWWDYWLKGLDTGIMSEPMLRAWMQDSVPPTMNYRYRPGRWVGERHWPSANVEYASYPLKRGKIAEPGSPVRQIRQTIQSPLSVGLYAGKWCSFTATPDLPHDQREEDGGSLVFTSAPLKDSMELLGSPVVELELASNQPQAMVAVRLSDVAPDDKATRITYGLLNLSHRNSHEIPEPLVPGERYKVQVRMNEIAQCFPKGHRLRLSISTSYWPLAWPAPQPARLKVTTGVSQLMLPVRHAPAGGELPVSFEDPEGAPPESTTLIVPKNYRWRVIRDLGESKATLEVIKDEGIYRHDNIDLTIKRSTSEWYSYSHDSYESLRGETRSVRGFSREGWSTESVTRTVLTSDAENFYVRAYLDAYEGDHRVFCQSWSRRIPRDHM